MLKNLMQYVMVGLLIAGAYFVGVYKTEVEYLKKAPAQVAQVQNNQQPGSTTPTTVDFAKVKALFDGKHITFGKENSKLVFVEISDPSCPYCHIAGGKDPELNKQVGAQFLMAADGGTYQPPVEEMRKLVDAKKASMVWIYTPGHGNGEMGTQALYCAYEKGKFWEAHDLLMSQKGYDLLNNTIKNDTTKSQELADFLAPAMNSAQMKKCLDAGTYKNHLTEDTSWVQALGFGATPTFFINDKVVEGAASWDSGFKSLVDPLI